MKKNEQIIISNKEIQDSINLIEIAYQMEKENPFLSFFEIRELAFNKFINQRNNPNLQLVRNRENVFETQLS